MDEIAGMTGQEISDLQDRVQYKLMDLALSGRLYLDEHGMEETGRRILNRMESEHCPGLVGSASPLADTGRYVTLAFKLVLKLGHMSPADQMYLRHVLLHLLLERVPSNEYRKI